MGRHRATIQPTFWERLRPYLARIAADVREGARNVLYS